MIKYLLYKDIDFIKYDRCIFEARNSLIYAFSWYLDCVASEWDVLVLNNYEAVMPLPKRSKFCIDYIYQPPWIQQLGVFSKIKLNDQIIELFIKAIPRKFKLVDMMFNFDNQNSGSFIAIRNNLILDLNKTYEELYDNYNSSRKKSVKRARNIGLKIKSIKNAETLINLFIESKGNELKRPESDYKILNQIIQIALVKNKVKIYTVECKNKRLLAGAVFLIHNNRIIYLFSAVNQEGKQSQAISFIIDFVIQKFSSNKMILDFEGSMIPGITDFFTSFGTINQPYFWFKRRSF